MNRFQIFNKHNFWSMATMKSFSHVLSYSNKTKLKYLFKKYTRELFTEIESHPLQKIKIQIVTK